MQIIVYETEHGVAITQATAVHFPTKRFAVVQAFADALEYLATGSYPIKPDRYQRLYTFDAMVSFLTHKTGTYSGTEMYTKFIENKLRPKPGAKMEIGLVYTRFCEWLNAHPDSTPSQRKFTREMRKLGTYDIRVSTMNGKCSNILYGATYAE